MDANLRDKILVIDDEKTNLTVINHILSPDYTVFTAKSGSIGLQRIAEDKPDLILLDIIMPDINGFDVLLRVKQDEEMRNIPVIIITGLTAEGDEEKGLLLGAVDYITKPFKNAIVKARIRTHLQIMHQMRLIERLGMIDPLTNIPNRRSFDDRMDMEWRRAIRNHTEISLLMLDVDKFKVYNDTYGHTQGDALLRALAGIFASAVRRPADMAARLGGEEFCVLLPDTNIDAALSIAETIRAAVEVETVPAADRTVKTSATVSIGVACHRPSPGDKAEEFVNEADKRLYAAKNSGRNRVVGPE
ncbi:MAG: diguanylate cyclase [Desulfovibrio sp.]|jgi:diguanylate cyclase (GGDEF)-like protein|nr:diguanylate cyclase [Desulfovibrio sp.]